MRAIAVQPDAVSDWQERLEWHFESFCRDGALDPATLWADVAQKERQLWVLEDAGEVQAVVLTRIAADRLKTCEVTHCAGQNRREWQHLFPALEHWAREIGCKRILAIVRPGWERILKDMKKTHVTLERAL